MELLRRLLHLIGYIVFIVLFAFGLRFFRSYFFAVLLFFFLIFPIISLVVTHYMVHHLQYEVITPVEVSKGGNFSVKIIARNNTFFPLSRHSFSFRINHLFYESSEEQTASFGVPIKGRSEITLPLKALYSGYIRLSLDKCKATDYLGFFTFQRKLSYPEYDILVLPLMLSGDFSTKTVGGTGMLELSETEVKGNDATQMIDVRSYRPGDKLNTIHWKLSVKMDELIVKEFGSLSDNDAIILLDLYYQEPTANDLRSNRYALINQGFDSLFDMLHTISHHLFDEKRPFTVYWVSQQTKDLVSQEITKPDELHDLYLRLFFEKKSTIPNESIDTFLRLDETGQDFIYLHTAQNQSAVQTEVMFENEFAKADIIRRS